MRVQQFDSLPLVGSYEPGLRALNGKKISLDMQCRCCGGDRVELVLDLGYQPHCNRLLLPQEPEPSSYPLRLGFCHDCTMVQIDHTIPKEEMFCDYPYVSSTTHTLVRHFKNTTKRLAKEYAIGHGDVVVDIGSNDGTWLQCWYDETEAEVLGIEADNGLAAQANAAGLATWNDFFDESVAAQIVTSMGHVTLATAAGVFFHLEELHSACRGINLMLKEDGVAVIQCIYLGDMLRNVAFDQIYHEHLCYYTLKSLQELLGRHGLSVFDVKRLPIHGGTIEAHICKAGVFQPSMAVLSTLEEERDAGLHSILPYHKFACRFTALKSELLTKLSTYRSFGHKVWAYGAPAKGATLLNSMGIGTDLVQCAVEKNPRKFGKIIPGCRVPIVAEGPDRPDAYLVLAWNFLDEFVAKEKEWLSNGGRFIVPVPHVREIGG